MTRCGNKILEAAYDYLSAGFSVIPVRSDGTKAPAVGSWTRYQSSPPTADELPTLFSRGDVGIAIVCGKVSGGMELIDVDDPAFVDPLHRAIQDRCSGLLVRLPRIETPRGGEHILYRCTVIEGNQKLACILDQNQKPRTVIETRGEGGYFVTVGSPAKCHPLNRTYAHSAGPQITDTPLITPGERMAILQAARSLNEVTRDDQAANEPAKIVATSGGRPGDEFNKRARWAEILEPHGWRLLRSVGETHYWQRPGKTGSGWSASTGHCTSKGGNDLLYVFSSNAAPFQGNCGYSKFAAYALLNWSGDYEAAARDLSQQGYGERRKPIVEASTADTLPEPPVPAWVSVAEVMRRPTYARGIPAVTTGFACLDRLLNGGLRSGQVSIMAGRTGSAKSQLAGNVARLSALSGTSTLFLSLEDSLEIAVQRLHAATSHVPLRLMIDGINNHGPAIDALRASYSILKDLPLQLSDVRSLADILRTLRQHAERRGKLVIIDQLSKITTTHLPAMTSTYERVNTVSESLRLAAAKFGLAILVVSQVNREAGKAPRDLQVNDLRDSGMLEQDAAAVLLLNKPKESPTCTGQSRAFARLLPIHLAKNRFGPSGGTAELLWYPRINRIDETAGGENA